MLFTSLKMLHIISAALLFGFSLSSAFYGLLANVHHDLYLIARILKQQLRANLVILFVGVLQLLSGFAMVFTHHYDLSAYWGVMSLVGFAVAGLCWLPTIYLQMKCRDIALQAKATTQILPRIYYHYVVARYCLGCLSVSSLLMVFYFMVYRSTYI